VRIASDFEVGGTLIHHMIGIALLHIGLDALGQTIGSAAPGDLDLAALEKDLERLAADRPPLTDLLHGERLGLRSYGNGDGSEFLGGRIVVQLGIIELDGLERDSEAALALTDTAARDKALDEVFKRTQDSWNPLVKISFMNVREAATHVLEADADVLVVLTQLRLEKARAADGTYPEKIDLPLDPVAKAPLRYTRSEDGKGYTLSSTKLTVSRR